MFQTIVWLSVRAIQSFATVVTYALAARRWFAVCLLNALVAA